MPPPNSFVFEQALGYVKSLEKSTTHFGILDEDLYTDTSLAIRCTALRVLRRCKALVLQADSSAHFISLNTIPSQIAIS